MKTKLAVVFLLIFDVFLGANALYCYVTGFVNTTSIPEHIAKCDDSKAKCLKIFGFTKGFGSCSALKPENLKDDDWKCEECDTHVCNGAFKCFEFDGEFGNEADRIYNNTNGCSFGKCYVEQYEGKEISRGCGSCSEGEYLWEGEYRKGGRMHQAYDKMARLPEHVRPKMARNQQSVEYSCTDCNTGLCNDEKMANKKPFLLKMRFCYVGVGSAAGGVFKERPCYTHFGDNFCIKEGKDDFVYKRCGICDEFPMPAVRRRKCFECSDNLCNKAIGRRLMPSMSHWLLLLGVVVPITMLLLPWVVNLLGGA